MFELSKGYFEDINVNDNIIMLAKTREELEWMILQESYVYAGITNGVYIYSSNGWVDIKEHLIYYIKKSDIIVL
jgi:hypothetical protein